MEQEQGSYSRQKSRLVIANLVSQMGALVKNLPANKGDAGLIPGSGRSPGEGMETFPMETHSSILAWNISWTEESGSLQSMGSQRVGQD